MNTCELPKDMDINGMASPPEHGKFGITPLIFGLGSEAVGANPWYPWNYAVVEMYRDVFGRPLAYTCTIDWNNLTAEITKAPKMSHPHGWPPVDIDKEQALFLEWFSIVFAYL